MNITITGRNFELTDSLKDYVYKKLEKLNNLHNRIYKCEVILQEGKNRKEVEIILHVDKHDLIAKESSQDFFASIDGAEEKVIKQIKKINSKSASKKRRGMLGRIIRPFAKENTFTGEIIKTNEFADKPMFPEEAKLELDVMGKDFMMFKNADTGESNVIYKRRDGSYGLIEPSF